MEIVFLLFDRWEIREKSAFHKICAISVVLHLLANFIFSALLLTVAMRNYPGGEAIVRLHSLERNASDVNVHIDVFAAQTGVSRFTEMNSAWK